MKIKKINIYEIKKAIDVKKGILDALINQSSLNMTDEILELSNELDKLIVDYYMIERITSF
ncbi:Spo0E family sporulation regulatory protein-aspartic acid phosphatase [Sedimentibacter sp.]|uniref:Spo0E family sporulation regulatory protein-aspartic acid phosphatase n=1 Tax=Sedimentibacter sp. TaxID=1960295 RepID=UPI00289902F1|nr:Spo0E family sporulation regulatory protein-aspartic acid phosphatase [Sedimentibacter sp.]